MKIVKKITFFLLVIIFFFIYLVPNKVVCYFLFSLTISSLCEITLLTVEYLWND